VRVRIEGYTDSVGNPNFNRLLSEHRANAVREYLIAQGIEPTRLVAVGRGADNPIAPNTTAQGRALNRRIEFHLSPGSDSGAVGSASPATQATEQPVQLEFRQQPERR